MACVASLCKRHQDNTPYYVTQKSCEQSTLHNALIVLNTLIKKKRKTLFLKILLGNMLQAHSWKYSSPRHIGSDGYTEPIFNLSHRLRACHIFFLTAPQSLLQPVGLIPTAGLKARDAQSAKDCKRPIPTHLHLKPLHP